MSVGYIIFGSPSIGPDEIAAVVQTLQSGWIGTGPRAKEFEQKFAEYIGCRYAVAVGDFPNAYRIGERTASIPLSPALTDDEVERVGQAVRDVLQK